MNKLVRFKVTDEELAKMKATQKKLGFKTFSEFARNVLLLDLEMKNVKEKGEEKNAKKLIDETKKQNHYLRKIGNNFNQLVREIHRNKGKEGKR